MAHGNKEMPLDSYPYMDNDLKTNGGDYVTHTELDEKINLLIAYLNDNFDLIKKYKYKKIDNVDILELNNTNFKDTVLKVIYNEDLRIGFLTIHTIANTQLQHDTNYELCILNPDNELSVEVYTSFNGLNVLGQINSSGKIDIKPIRDINQDSSITIGFVYILKGDEEIKQ